MDNLGKSNVQREKKLAQMTYVIGIAYEMGMLLRFLGVMMSILSLVLLTSFSTSSEEFRGIPGLGLIAAIFFLLGEVVVRLLKKHNHFYEGEHDEHC